MPQWVKTGLLVGGSALGGGLANRATTQTTTPTLSPELQGLQTDLVDTLRKRMADPAQGTEPIRLGLLESVNRNYRGLPNRVGTALAKRGMGRSGQMGAALKGVEMGRLGEISDVNTSMANTVLGRQDSAMEIINRLLSGMRGMTSTGSGNVLGGAVGSGIQTLTTLTMLDKMLKGAPAVAGAVSTAGVPSAAAVNAGLPSVLDTVGIGLPTSAGAAPGIAGVVPASDVVAGTAAASDIAGMVPTAITIPQEGAVATIAPGTTTSAWGKFVGWLKYLAPGGEPTRSNVQVAAAMAGMGIDLHSGPKLNAID